MFDGMNYMHILEINSDRELPSVALIILCDLEQLFLDFSLFQMD